MSAVDALSVATGLVKEIFDLIKAFKELRKTLVDLQTVSY